MRVETDSETLNVLNPTAVRYGGDRQRLTPRPASLEGLTVGLLWNGKANGDLALRTVAEHLRMVFPGVVTKLYSGRIRCDSALLDQVADECDVVVGCTADCGSCTSWMAHDCIQLERMGLPAVVIASAGFEDNLQASAKAFALPDLEFVRVPHVYNNATEEIVVEQTVEAMPRLVQLLTGGFATSTDGDVAQAGGTLQIPVSGAAGAMRAFNDDFSRRGWTDGYPVWPSTEQSVGALVDAVGARADEVLFPLPPGNGELTVEKLAVNCAMAGCTAGEMAVVEAILRTFADHGQRTMIRTALMSTSAHAPLVVVNGPVARQLGINGGRSCVGPGTQNEVNIRISRAVGLALRNVGRWTPGVMDLDTIGTTRKNIVVLAENEQESPWNPFHVDHGAAASDSVVTLFFTLGEWDIGLQGHLDADNLARGIGSFSGGNSGTGYFASLFGGSDDSPVGRLMLMAPVHAQALDEGGLDKTRVRDILFETGKEPAGRLVEPMRKLHRDGKILPQWEWVFELEDEELERTLLPVIERPEHYHVVVAGSARGKNLLMPTRCHPITKPVREEWLR